MRQPEFQNSAGRLHALLRSIPAGRSLLEVLPPLIGVDSKDSKERQQATLRVLMELHQVYIEFCEDMLIADISEKQREMMLKGLGGLRETLYPINLDGPLRPPNETEIHSLKVCATFIEEDSPITVDDIEAIRTSIADLRSQVDNSKISPTLRKALRELIRLSEDVINRFNIHGARGLKRAFKAMLADAAELFGMVDPTMDREDLKTSPAWAAILEHLRIVDSVASKLLKYKPLLETAGQLLIGGPPIT